MQFRVALLLGTSIVYIGSPVVKVVNVIAYMYVCAT